MIQIGNWMTLDTKAITGVDKKAISQFDTTKEAYIATYSMKGKTVRLVEDDNHLINNPYPVFFREDVAEVYGYEYGNLFFNIQWQLWIYRILASNLKIGIVHKPVVTIDHTLETDKNPYASLYGIQIIRDRKYFDCGNISYFDQETFFNTDVKSPLMKKSLDLLKMSHDETSTNTLINHDEEVVVINPVFKMAQNKEYCKKVDENKRNVLLQSNNLVWFYTLLKEPAAIG